ncbi:MAG: hypothetical protein QW279_16300, partial [Candidatus Jordarchaeaceae archaeon]
GVSSVQVSTNTTNIWTISSADTSYAYLSGVLIDISLSSISGIFVENGVLNHVMVVGDSAPHGAFGIGAWTVDVYSGIMLAQALGRNAWRGLPEAAIDTWVASYNAITGSVQVTNLKDNLIVIAGYGVNLLTYEYFTDFRGAFSSGRQPLAPVYFHRDWTPNPADVRTWIVFPGEPLTYSDWDIVSGFSDYCLIELVYDRQNGRVVLGVTSFTAQGTEAGCRALAAMLMGQSLPFNISGQAVLLKWVDGNVDGKVQLSEISLVKTYR